MSETQRKTPPGIARVATWNIHGAIGGDRTRNVIRLAHVIRDLDLDAIALQEVDNRDLLPGSADMLEELAERTGMHPVPGYTIAEDKGTFGNALLLRRPPMETHRRDITVDHKEPRGLLSVETPVGADALRLVATHFGLRAWERRAQMAELERLIRTADPLPTVVCGDFNEWNPLSRVSRRLQRLGHQAPLRRTFPAHLPIFPLDRMVVLRPARLMTIEKIAHPMASAASDHLLLMAQIALDRIS